MYGISAITNLQEKNMEICMSVLILLCILFCLLVQQHYKREMEAVYQGLLLKLDRAITLGAKAYEGR